MKITIVNGENSQVKYISSGKVKVVEITDFSNVKEEPRHHLEWGTSITLDEGLNIIKTLFEESQGYQCSKDDKDEKELPYQIVVAGRMSAANQPRLYPIEHFLELEHPHSKVQKNDVSIGLLTSHYALHFSNRSQTLHESIDCAQVSAYSNISSSLARIIAITSPAFTDQKDVARSILAYQLDKILAAYPKPVKVN